MRRWDLFVLSWESLRRVEWGKVSSFLSMSGGGLFNSLCTISLYAYRTISLPCILYFILSLECFPKY